MVQKRPMLKMKGDYSDCTEQFREIHFQKEEKKLRYEMLKERLEEALSNGKL